ncbi:hypothetical protein BOW50_11930 [Solemya velum gill symbiont]|uniref:AAA family ATPase n=1 Tax=Solemya velum gill symbiont TaxID=2340 RepID=UPI000996603D|nr:AAA family ATPase [Solemya velum gill symbiont]OOZ75388.1 hypothetical protein BOW50_11930 [Solemya velum gill symbiont]
MNTDIAAITNLFPERVTSATAKEVETSSVDAVLVERISESISKTNPSLFKGYWASTSSCSISEAILGNKFESQSEADMALAKIIANSARRLGAPEAQLHAVIEEVFSRSGLANRDKWKDRPDYRNRTISKAIVDSVPPALATITETGNKDVPLSSTNGKLKLSTGDPVPRDWILTHCLLIGKSAILAGLGGVSKTQFLVQLAIAIALGITFMGLPTKQGKVILLLGEEDKGEAERRFNAEIRCRKRSAQEIQQIEENVHVFGLVGEDTRLTRKSGGSLEATELAEEIIQLAKNLGDVRLIGLDHAGLYHGGDFNAREDAALTMRLVNHIAHETGAAAVLLAHSPKSSAKEEISDASQVFGSTAFVDQARCVLMLATMRENEAKEYQVPENMRRNHVSLTIIKNNYGPTGDVHWFRRESYDGVGLLEHVTLTTPVPGTKGGHTLDNLVRDFIINHRGQFSKTKLRDTHGGKDGPFRAGKNQVAAAVEEMLSDGRLVARTPTDAECNKFGHGPRVTHVLDLGADQ